MLQLFSEEESQTSIVFDDRLHYPHRITYVIRFWSYEFIDFSNLGSPFQTERINIFIPLTTLEKVGFNLKEYRLTDNFKNKLRKILPHITYKKIYYYYIK